MMNCLSFFDGCLAEKIRHAARVKTTVVMFLHVPKTGGTSAQRDLKFSFPNGIHIANPKRDDSWEQLVQRLRPGKTEVIRGHLSRLHCEDIRKKGHSLRTVCYLRDPFDRLVSEFHWRKSKFPERFPDKADAGSFNAFIDAKPSNSVCNLLVGPCSSSAEAIEKVVEQFWFVGLTEYFHVCQAVLMASLGKAYRIRRRLNSSRSDEEAPNLRTLFLEKARQKFEIDFEIFEFFQSRWQSRVNDVGESLMRVNRREKTDIQETCRSTESFTLSKPGDTYSLEPTV